MNEISVRVPDVVLARHAGSVEETARYAQSLLALKFFELGHVSCGDAATMCEMNVVDFLLFAEKAGVPASVLYGIERGRAQRGKPADAITPVEAPLPPASRSARSGAPVRVQ